MTDFEKGSRYETLLALCHLPRRDTRDHARRSWHIFELLLRLERGEKTKGTTFEKTFEEVKDQLREGFRVVHRNRPLTGLHRSESKAFVEAVDAAQDSAALLEVIASATAWFKTL